MVSNVLVRDMLAFSATKVHMYGGQVLKYPENLCAICKVTLETVEHI